MAAAAGLLLTSTAGLLGAWHWALDLLAHFRWHYLAAALTICGVAALLRSRHAMLLGGLAAALNAALIAPFMLALPGELRATPVLDTRFAVRFVSFNVLTANTRKQQVLDYLRRADADVLLVLEIDQEWQEALEPLRSSHPYWIAEPRSDNFGIALYSRLQPKAVEFERGPGEAWPASILARFEIGGTEFDFIGTHPVPPVGPHAAASRNTQLASLAAAMRASARPTLVLGDLNSTPWCHGMALLRDRTDLSFGTPSGIAWPTWYGRRVLALPIDHALSTAPLIVTERRIGPNLGSDHRPITIELRRVGVSR